MGGIGSGGYEHQRTKGTVTNDRALDIRYWQREGVMKPGLRFEVRWGQQDTLILGVAVRVEKQQVVLAYRHSRSDGSLTQVEYPITLDWTPCPFGSQRPWFRCPTEGCGKRVAILHLDCNAQFTCRHCQGLAYSSQRENAIDRNLRRARKIARKLSSREGSINSSSDKPKRMRWRTYRGLVNDANAATLRAMRAVLNQAHR